MSTEAESELIPLDLPSIDDHNTVVVVEGVQRQATVGRKRKRDTQHPSEGQHEGRDSDGQTTTEELGMGVVYRAPLPVDQVGALEESTGAGNGEYFVEMMRRRYQCILDLQNKWLSRERNVKDGRYVETQMALRSFSESVIYAFESIYGPKSQRIASPQPRRHSKARLVKIAGCTK